MEQQEINLKIRQVIDEFTAFINKSLWKDKYSFALKNMQEEINAPCVLAIAGKVKAGKSFLVNALLGIDIAMTGNTETTATVNIFKKGTPPSKDKPILCVYVDGHKEWVTKSYLDSLQGTSEESLAKTSQIDRLIMYIDDNPLLDYVTFVDTPGIGAEVGEEGDSHQIHTDAYFQLRKRHEQDTINLSNTADAIIYLFNTVPTETDKNFLGALYDGGNGLTSLNGIGVLSKIDKDLTQVDNIPRFCKEFEHNLFTILPTSATVEKYLPNEEKARQLQAILRQGFSQEKGFVLALGSETAFLHERLPFCNLSVTERKSILNGFAEKDLAWSTFALIAKRIYYAENISETLAELRKIGGISVLRETIFNQFFKRSHMLRGNKVVEELRRIISDIEFDDAYIFAEDRAKMKDRCIASCESLPNEVKTIIHDLIVNHIPTIEQVRTNKNKVRELKVKLETLQNELKTVNDKFLIYQKIIAEKKQFSQLEFDELCSLFAGQTKEYDARSRYKYWAGVYNMSPIGSIRQQAAMIAKEEYSKTL